MRLFPVVSVCLFPQGSGVRRAAQRHVFAPVPRHMAMAIGSMKFNQLGQVLVPFRRAFGVVRLEKAQGLQPGLPFRA